MLALFVLSLRGRLWFMVVRLMRFLRYVWLFLKFFNIGQRFNEGFYNVARAARAADFCARTIVYGWVMDSPEENNIGKDN